MNEYRFVSKNRRLTIYGVLEVTSQGKKKNKQYDFNDGEYIAYDESEYELLCKHPQYGISFCSEENIEESLAMLAPEPARGIQKWKERLRNRVTQRHSDYVKDLKAKVQSGKPKVAAEPVEIVSDEEEADPNEPLKEEIRELLVNFGEITKEQKNDLAERYGKPVGIITRFVNDAIKED